MATQRRKPPKRAAPKTETRAPPKTDAPAAAKMYVPPPVLVRRGDRTLLVTAVIVVFMILAGLAIFAVQKGG